VKLQVGLVVLELIGGVLIAYLSWQVIIAPTTEFLSTIASAALTVGSILIAVLGVMASLYVTQNLKGTVAGKEFTIMIALIALGMALSFLDGIVGLYASSQLSNLALVKTSWSLFVVAIYSTMVSVVASTISILR
jgi:hypothetical protein